MKKAAKALGTAVFISAVVFMYYKIGCPLRFFLGISCPGCGMTHAVISLLHFDFLQAYYCHPAVFALIPAAAACLALRKKEKALYAVVFSFCALLLVIYIIRLSAGSCPDFVFFHPEDGKIYNFSRRFLLCQ